MQPGLSTCDRVIQRAPATSNRKLISLGNLYGESKTMSAQINHAISLLEQGLGQLYETELESLAIGMGASEDISDGQGEEHHQELIDMIKEMLLSAGKGKEGKGEEGKPAAKKPAAKKPAEEEDEEEKQKPIKKPAAKKKPAKEEKEEKEEKSSKLAWTAEHYTAMSVADLKAYCKECGVKSTGSKAKLVEWIMEAPWNKFKEEKLEEMDDPDEEALAEVRESWDTLDEEEQGEYA